MRKLSRAALEKQVQALAQRVDELDDPAGPLVKLPEVELALRERIKELGCLYAISRLQEQHFTSAEQFLQGVADTLPRSWCFVEFASARVVHGGRQYTSENFHDGPWRMSEPVHVQDAIVGAVEVCYRKGVPASPDGPFLPEEHALLHAVAERISSALMQIQTQADLREANRLLSGQHQALHETNIALRTVLSRLEEEKREIRASILSNIQKIIMPIVFELELAVTGRQRSYVTLLRQSLQEITSPFLSQLTTSHVQLTPVEVAISTMVRNGLSTKDIAQLRCISVGTVRRHRENIRHKLGLTNRKANLVTFLQSAGGSQSPELNPANPAQTPRPAAAVSHEASASGH